MTIPTIDERREAALTGMFIGDALAMPVHWYYDTEALRRDYGQVTDYLKPHNPHPDSILWRSSYRPPNRRGDILHEQGRYWGQKEIHYHQFLEAGENTLNLQLARQLLLLLSETGRYRPGEWLDRLIRFMTEAGNHRDTYVEEYLRHFFLAYANGIQPLQCGRPDENHIGGYTLMLPLLLALDGDLGRVRETALEHLALTHGGARMHGWGSLLALAITDLLQGADLAEAVSEAARRSTPQLDLNSLEALREFDDRLVITKHFSSACYVDFAVPATLYLALKYRDDPEQALIVNTGCGGDNCGRGAVLGALLGALRGNRAWPKRWCEGLLQPPPPVRIALD